VMIAEATLASVPTMLAQGDTKRTIEALERVRRVSDDITYTQERATFAGCQAAVAEATGDEVSLFRWLDEFCKYDGFLLTIPIVTIRLLHERTNKASERRLKTLYDICHRENLQYFLILERIGQAIASTKSEEALSLLGDALAMGKPEGYIRTFVDWGILLAPLLRKAVREGIEPEYARKLLDIIETEDHQRRIRRGELLPTSTTPNRLSERETDVLRFLAEGLSNQEIARKLVISTNTAKAHVRHILQKLDARDRLGAVMRAKELKLI
jgi:ATP/maltotriose-dependent transcriptional regulator MalT